MKTVFKPLGLAAAVAAVTAGYVGGANAFHPDPARNGGNLGDLAIIPYYTVQDDWITGVHIINSANVTQVVKLRLRRASDSADALDFNLIMSPYDEWTGFIDDSSGDIVFATEDKTCTAPELPGGRAVMPDIFRVGAEEGYIEVISMGSPINAAQPIHAAALHASGVPADCVAVRSNFFIKTAAAGVGQNGVVNNFQTHQSTASINTFNANNTCITAGGTAYGPGAAPANSGPGVCENDFVEGAGGLKVSYFFRDAAAGAEAGGNAAHITNFSTEAWMSNQQTGLFSGDITGFDYPGLDGGPLGYTAANSPAWAPFSAVPGTALRDRFNTLRTARALGSVAILNDWSVATARNVSTDWVVTLPGQHTMLDYGVWASPQVGFDTSKCGTLDDPNTGAIDGIALCDFRDIPVVADLDLWDREEGVIQSEQGGLVISPAPPGTTNQLILPNEVNVIEWTDGVNEPVLGSNYAVAVDVTPLGAEFGWANLAVFATPKTTTGGVAATDYTPPGQAICEYIPYPPMTNGVIPAVVGDGKASSSHMRTSTVGSNIVTSNTRVCDPATGNIPIIGFVMWERTFTSAAENYARLIDHSFRSM